jgi:hypothetical protein
VFAAETRSISPWRSGRFVVTRGRQHGFKLVGSGQANEMFLPRAYAFLTAATAVGILMMAAFMNT